MKMPIDASALEVYREIMEDETDAFIAEILANFYINTRGLLASLDKSFKENDVEEFVRAVHTLRSTSATVGARRVSNLATDLETRGGSEPLENLRPLIRELNEAYEEAERELKEIYT